MVRWEYRVCTSFGDGGNLIHDLGQLGEMGWECYSTTKRSGFAGVTYTSYLKRIKS